MPIPTSGLIHKYDLLDPACYTPGGNIYDLVGSLDLGPNGSPTYDPTYGSLTWNGLGIGAYSTAGQYANITTTFSFSFWIKVNDISVLQLLFNNGERTSAWSGYSAFLDNSTGKIDFGANFVWGGYHGCPVIDPTKWYNITYTFNAGTLKFYLDGVLVGTSTGLGSPIAYGPNAYLAFGGNATAFFNPPQFQNKASYGVVIYYNVELNSTEVADIYLTYVDRFLGPLHEYDAANPSSYPGSGSSLVDVGSGTPINLTINNANFDNITDSFELQGTLTSYIRSAQGLASQIGIGTNNFTYQLWWQYNGQANIGGPLDVQLQVGSRGAGTYGGCTITTNGGQVLIESPGVGQLSTGWYPTLGEWYLVTLTVNSSNLNTLYVNGVSTYTGTQAYGALNSLASIALGPSITNLGDGSLSGYGPIQIYNRVLSSGEITTYYNNTFARFSPAVHGYDAADPASYPGSGSTLFDIGSATAIDLSISNATFDNVTDSFTLSGASSSYIRSAGSYANFDIGANDFTIQYWFKYNGVTAQPPYNIFLQIGSRSGSFSGFTHSTFSGEFVIGKPGVADYNTGFYPTLNQWYQATMTVNSSNLVTLYIDGVSVYSSTISFVTPATILAMGDNGINADQVANASMGPLFIYDRVLSNTEITDYYSSTQSRFAPVPPPAGLVGGRTFGQGFAG